MTDKCETPYGTYAPILDAMGLDCRPSLEKGCKEKGWTKTNDELGQEVIKKWYEEKANYNIGLLMGTLLPNGNRIGALDIDHDNYVEVTRYLLNNPKCGRFGSKGIVFFFQYPPHVKFPKKLKNKGELSAKNNEIGEFLTERHLCILPPSIHPDTGEPYRWVGTPLFEMDLNKLPLIGE